MERAKTAAQIEKLERAKKLIAEKRKLEKRSRRWLRQFQELQAAIRRMTRESDRLIEESQMPISRPGPRGHGPGGKTLRETILMVLEEAPHPLPLGELAETVLAAGFETASPLPTFKAYLANTLAELGTLVKRTRVGWAVGPRALRG